EEVVRDIAQESAIPATPASAAAVARPVAGGLAADVVELDLDLDLSQIKVDAEAAGAMSRQLASLTAEQRGDQLQRLERGLLRLERTNLQILQLLQKLVGAVARPNGDESKKP
ncbi:MAG TPA: ATPase, partial [Burkholderiaceae bacterium]|nr:ATPase [Burkholderiaceae bacterium]